MSFTDKRHKVEQGVLKILEMDPYIADGPQYKKLILLYWVNIDKAFQYDKESGYYYTTPEDFAKATSPESITRAFRKLVEAEVAKLLPSTEKRRRDLETEYKTYHIEEKQ